jgi:hypothetical protein
MSVIYKENMTFCSRRLGRKVFKAKRDSHSKNEVFRIVSKIHENIQTNTKNSILVSSDRNIETPLYKRYEGTSNGGHWHRNEKLKGSDQ